MFRIKIHYGRTALHFSKVTYSYTDWSVVSVALKTGGSERYEFSFYEANQNFAQR